MAIKTYRTESILAGLLFILATGATMVSQIITEPMLSAPDVVERVSRQSDLFLLGFVFEVVNALASAGIAIALFPILRRCIEGVAVAYVSLRAIEASMGIVAAIGLLLLLSPGIGSSGDGLVTLALTFHDKAFLLVLIVFSVGTLVFYPLLYKTRLVPVLLSVWGLIGGLMLLVSGLLILFGRIEIGGGTDMLLSLPIWINEMALALWLIFKGIDTTALTGRDQPG